MVSRISVKDSKTWHVGGAIISSPNRSCVAKSDTIKMNSFERLLGTLSRSQLALPISKEIHSSTLWSSRSYVNNIFKRV